MSYQNNVHVETPDFKSKKDGILKMLFNLRQLQGKGKAELMKEMPRPYVSHTSRSTRTRIFVRPSSAASSNGKKPSIIVRKTHLSTMFSLQSYGITTCNKWSCIQVLMFLSSISCLRSPPAPGPCGSCNGWLQPVTSMTFLLLSNAQWGLRTIINGFFLSTKREYEVCDTSGRGFPFINQLCLWLVIGANYVTLSN